jgi:7-cyano-7-deazaguanine synthase
MTDLTIMYSGGLDSFIAWHYAKKIGFNPQAIYVNLGHPYAHKELDSMNRLSEKFGISIDYLDMTTLYNLIQNKLNNQIIPSRNVMLATIGAMFNPIVWINALDGEQNGKEHDKSYRFFADTTELLSFTNEFFQERTTITSPFAHMSKAETIKWALANGLSKEDLFETTSCYDGEETKCGKCLTCYKRKVAFLLNGVDEPGYKQDPLNSSYAKEVDAEITKAIENNDYTRFTRKRIKEHQELKDILNKRG